MLSNHWKAAFQTLEAAAPTGLNRIETETSVGVTHQYKYDLNGNRTNTVYGVTVWIPLNCYFRTVRADRLV